MVKLSEQIELSAIEEKRMKKKLGGGDHVISREIKENNHQVPSVISFLLLLIHEFHNSITEAKARDV